MAPLVSILMPNLNYRRFLPERFNSIFGQTYQDWELIVNDNYSNDGSWEFIQEFAGKDPRVKKIFQSPAEGIYPAINRCLPFARGKYVYIATSDDTMENECVEKMVEVLEAYPDCGLAHCCLKILDEDGHWLKGEWENYPALLFYGNIIHQKHIRRAPLDGVLNLSLDTVYISLTQLLIRRGLFDEIGPFRNDWASHSDFEWEMRASLTTDVVHVPEYLAMWRAHPRQATALNKATSIGQQQLLEMCQAALPWLERKFPGFLKGFNKEDFLMYYRYGYIRALITKRRAPLGRIFYVALSQLRHNPGLLLYGLFRVTWDKIRTGVDYNDLKIRDVRKKISALGLEKCIEFL